MAGFDFEAAVRWARFAPRATLARRRDADLPFLDAAQVAGSALLLDTCVYIDRLQGRAPAAVVRAIATRPVNHATVAIQELMHTVGVLNPDDPRTAAAVSAIGRQIDAMRPHRIFAPDPDVLGRAALLSGILCRLQGYAAEGRLRALQDCVLFLLAQKLGLAVLTRNIADFDGLLQLIPAGRVLLYRTA